MKRLITILMLLPLVGSAQTITKKVDEFKGTVTHSVEPAMVERSGDNGLVILLYCEPDETMIILRWVGITGCNEKNELIFLLEDGEKVALKSWNKFNCDATAYFRISNASKEKLASSPIKAIRFINGFKFHSITVNEVDNSRYFMNYYKNLSEYEF